MNEYAGSMADTGSLLVTSDQEQESSWILASQRGDRRAFNRLVLKWEKAIYNVALRMLHDREDAAEATQEVFLLAFKSIRRFRRDAKFSTWVYRIALNHCLTRLKQRPLGTHFSLDHERKSESPVAQLQVAGSQVRELMEQEQQNRVRFALSHLPPDQQAVIELKFFQERTFEEIAAILETPLSTIKSRLYSGLETLKIRLGSKA
jgi:RNA polymerase sigma-70 factor (ECF subfamily)